jgi:uncharacterized membrane protein
MTHDRLHALTDGIFAIVMTLLVLELKVPEIANRSDATLWHSLVDQKAIFISYFISFAVLFVYWRAHNFVITILAKNIDINLLNLNGIFLLLVGLVPFTTHLLGVDSETPLAIVIYALNIILIGLTLLWMRLYVEKSDSIENLERTAEQRKGALIRTLTPVVCATIAIPLSFVSTSLAFGVLLIAVAYNFHNNAADITDRLFIKPFMTIKRELTGKISS